MNEVALKHICICGDCAVDIYDDCFKFEGKVTSLQARIEELTRELVAAGH